VCLECQRLWEEYAKATKEQLQLMESLPLAKEDDYEKLIELERQVDEAAAGRQIAWQRIKDHEAKEHPKSP